MDKGELSLRQEVTWKVPNFFQLPLRTGFSLLSPEFCFACDRYRLKLFPNDMSTWSDRSHLSVAILNLTESVPGRTVSHKVWLKSRTGERIDLSRIDTFYGEALFVGERRKFEEYKDLYVPDGNLMLILSMRLEEISSVGSTESDEAEGQERLPCVTKLQSDYKQLLQKGTDSDACLVVSGKEFPVHRCVLRSRSTVFEAMFSHETTEKESGRVVINDLDRNSFEDFLEYLYTGVVGAGLSDDNAFGLYAAADKYDVPNLKSECVAHMRTTLSVDSFCDVMNIALRHCEEDLLKRAVQFFKQNLSRIIVTPKWQQFVLDNGTSANELFIKALVPKEQ